MAITTFSVVTTAVASKEVEENPLLTMLPISRTDGKKGKSGNAIVVPQVSDAVLNLILANDTGKEWMIDAVNALRSKLASKLNKDGKEITSTDLGIDALLVAMIGETSATRFSAESIGAWFDAQLAAYIEVALHAKGLPTGVADKTVATFKAVFQKLSSRTTRVSENEINQMTKAMSLIPEDSEAANDMMTEKVAVKLAEAADTPTDVIINVL